MKLLDEVKIKRPRTCATCPFGSYDADDGDLCCGHKRDYFTTEEEKGNMRFHTVQTPKEAYEHGCECEFVTDDPED